MSAGAVLAAILGLACSLVALCIAVWIVLPAPTPAIATLAVAASEWSLLPGALGLAGIALGLLGAWGSTGPGSAEQGATTGAASLSPRLAVAWLGPLIGAAALLLSLDPLIEAWQAARANGVQLDAPWRNIVGPIGMNTPPPGVETVAFARAGGTVLYADVLRPARAGATGLSAAVVVVHGGAWSSGERGAVPAWNRWLAEQGYVVFDVDYRLSPPPAWRDATGDVKCAVAWVRRNAAAYGVDPARIALLGRSAGAQLALLAAYTPGLAALPPSCEDPTADTSVRAVIDFYGPADLAWGYDYPANQAVIDGPETLRTFLGSTPETDPERYALASPITHVKPGVAPTLLLHGGRDQLVLPEQTRRLEARLRDASVPYRAVLLPWAQHGFDYLFEGWGSQVARPIVRAFLEEYLR